MTPSARSRSTFERPTATGGRRWSLATRTLSTGPLPGYFGSRWGQSPTAGRWPTLSRLSLPTSSTRITATMMAGRGDLLPVSALPVDGTFPTGTARWEKRSIAEEIPIWDPEICIDCGRCALVCPHAAIRFKAFDAGTAIPDGFLWKEPTGTDLAGQRIAIQVAPDDCTGCGICVEVCPAKSKEVIKHKALNMAPKHDHLDRERRNFEVFLGIRETDRALVNAKSVKGSQLLEPLFEFSGACAGCGETPYLKLLTQMFGDRMIVANATGCSSIYGGNLPTTPWTTDSNGRGPAWSNSLFEDNAEFGLGMRLAMEAQRSDAILLVTALAPELGQLAADILELAENPDHSEQDALIARQRELVAELKVRLSDMEGPLPRRLEGVADSLIETSIWIVGGDGWAYDIGFGGLDHVLGSGRNVNILVLDTEVYSNTGGQASKATPRAAIAKFAAGGKTTGKKDLGQIAMAYGNVYVGQIAMGANPTQTVKTIAEAEEHRGVSLVIAYSPCIAHGLDMRYQLSHQKAATDSGYWPLYRYDPARESKGDPGLRLDSRAPTIRFEEFARSEARFAMLGKVDPEDEEELLRLAQADIDDRWHLLRADGARSSDRRVCGGRGMSVDLSTSYLGLDLAHPVLPSASPLTGDIDHIHALVEAGAPAIVLPSLFEEQIEHNAMAVHHSLELGADGFARDPRWVLSTARRLQHRAGGLPDIGPPGEEGDRRARDRKPQRHLDRGMDSLCPDPRRRGHRRPGAQHLPNRRQHQPRGKRDRGRLPTPRRDHSRGDRDPTRREDRALLLLDRKHGRSTRRRRSRRPRHLQPAVPARHRHTDSRGDSQAGAIGAGGTETRAALAGHPPRPDRVRSRGDHRCS